MYVNDPDAVFRPSPASDVYFRELHHFSIFLLPYVVILSYLSKLQSVYLMKKKQCSYNTDIHWPNFVQMFVLNGIYVKCT